MTIVLINPNLIFQRNDPFTTGIVYMPVGLAYLAAILRQSKEDVVVIDAFGQKPASVKRDGKFTILGLHEDEILALMPEKPEMFFVYANQISNHISVINIIKAVRQQFCDVPIVVMENTQAVTSYSLTEIKDEFFMVGASFIMTGESEFLSLKLLKTYRESGLNMENYKEIEGLIFEDSYNPPKNPILELDRIPFPAWDLFPLKNYWNLRFSHGPLSSHQYLPLLTSRGCPYACRFCVVPATNHQKWRSRSANNVVDEMEFWVKELGVSEFHIEDLDPTINDQRIRDISDEILKRKLEIKWKIVAGTKVETIKNRETLEKMAASGCTYISISPETGSPKVLKSMNKPFDLNHAKYIIKNMNELNIRSQACFVLGFPDEMKEDRVLTQKLVEELTIFGVDEIALFIVSPVPGSEIYNLFKGYNTLSDLNFTPTWRTDYKELANFRLKLYISFLLLKTRYHFLKVMRQAFNFLRRRFETKMEMIPYRALVLTFFDLTH